VRLREEECGRFTIVADETTMSVAADGRLLLEADRDYVVRVPAGTTALPLAGALRRPPGATDATLRFRGFIGDTRLDGRAIGVWSRKLTARQVDEMLRGIGEQMASLPFVFTTPTGAEYARDVVSGEDIAYQSAVLILDALAGRGRHDLPGAIARVLNDPYTVLAVDRATVPLALADRLSSTTLLDVVAGPSLSEPLPDAHHLARSPLAIACRGRVPDRLSIDRVRSEIDNMENRFVIGVLDACLRVVDETSALASASGAPGAPALERDCAEARETLRVWRTRRPFHDLGSPGPAPLGSTVLQRRPGYREVLAFWMDLVARSRWLPPRASAALLALRDAPTLYEYWCYFAVIDAVSDVAGPPVRVDRPEHGATGSLLRWASRATFASGVQVVFNERFPGAGSSATTARSSSVPLRPDIVLHVPGRGFHVLDAKFRRAGSAVALDDEGGDGEADAIQADIHKMHAYRDALGCRSAWVLYPGRGPVVAFPPLGDGGSTSAEGVGVLPLVPGHLGDSGLASVVAEMLGAP
jgi:hypothetical protein